MSAAARSGGEIAGVYVGVDWEAGMIRLAGWAGARDGHSETRWARTGSR